MGDIIISENKYSVKRVLRDTQTYKIYQVEDKFHNLYELRIIEYTKQISESYRKLMKMNDSGIQGIYEIHHEADKLFVLLENLQVNKEDKEYSIQEQKNNQNFLKKVQRKVEEISDIDVKLCKVVYCNDEYKLILPEEFEYKKKKNVNERKAQSLVKSETASRKNIKKRFYMVVLAVLAISFTIIVILSIVDFEEISNSSEDEEISVNSTGDVADDKTKDPEEVINNKETVIEGESEEAGINEAPRPSEDNGETSAGEHELIIQEDVDYTIPIVEQTSKSGSEVEFKDKALEDCIRILLDKRPDEAIFIDELDTFEGITILGNYVFPTFAGIEMVRYRDEDFFSYNFIYLDQKFDVKIRGNIKSLEDLKYFKNLRSLTIRSNQINNLRGVEELSKLRFLDLADNYIESQNLSVLTDSNITYLNIDANKLISLEPLGDCLNRLESLYAAYNEIGNINILANCIQLEAVDFEYNKIANDPGIVRLEAEYKESDPYIGNPFRK